MFLKSRYLSQALSHLFKSRMFILTAGISLLLVLAVTVFNLFFLPSWLSAKLVKAVKVKSQGLYTLQIGSLHTSLLSGSLTLNDIRLVPDFVAWERQRAAKAKVPAMLLQLKARQLHLGKLGYLSLLGQSPLRVGELTCSQPQVQVFRMQQASGPQQPLHRSLKSKLNGLRIRHIQVEQGSLTLKNHYRAKSPAHVLRGVYLQAANLQLDSAGWQDQSRVCYARRIVFRSSQANLLLPQGYYRLKTGPVAGSTRSGTVTISKLALVPQYKPQELSRRKGRAVTWLSLQVPELRLRQVNFSILARSAGIEAGTIQVRNPVLHAYMDRKHFPQVGEKPLPHDLVRKLKSRLAIRKVEVHNMYIRYEELAPRANKTGFFTFEQLHATISHISNDTSRAAKATVIDLKTAVMGKTALQATIRLHLLHPAAYHTIRGTVGPTPAGLLNNILEATSGVSIKSGFLQKGKFQVRLRRDEASGTMQAYYRDLEIELLSRKKDKRQSLGKKLLSAFVNKAAVDSDNSPKEEEGFRTGQIVVARKKNRSVFNYWKDCLASGLLSSAGLEQVSRKK